MEIHHGWNAHFQDDILTVREDDGISILDWMFVSRFFDYIMFQMDIHHGWNRSDIRQDCGRDMQLQNGLIEQKPKANVGKEEQTTGVLDWEGWANYSSL